MFQALSHRAHLPARALLSKQKPAGKYRLATRVLRKQNKNKNKKIKKEIKMSETLTPQAPQGSEGLSSQDEQKALFLRNQQRGIAENIGTAGIRLANAEKTGDLSVVTRDKALEVHKSELGHFENEARQHAEANLGAYQETAKREAEEQGHSVN
jgi:hypothetical protein